MEENKEKTQEEIIKEAVEEAKKAAKAAETEKEQEEASSSDSDAEAAEAAEAKAEEPSEESTLGKNKKDKKDEKIAELNDRLMRQMAEFDNFRKRTDREKSQMYEIGAKDVIEKILPIVDNFERGLDGVAEEEKEAPFVQGMQLIYRQMMDALEGLGVKPMDAVGKEFDPEYHNAVMHIEDESLGENIVAEEFQKGYMYRDSVVRHSMVKVAN